MAKLYGLVLWSDVVRNQKFGVPVSHSVCKPRRFPQIYAVYIAHVKEK